MSKKVITANDLYRLEQLVWMDLASDEERLVYSKQVIEKKSNKARAHLWLTNVNDKNSARQFTYGNHFDTTPIWSPDGKYIAFTRKTEKGQELRLIASTGGESWPLSKGKEKFFSYCWMPNGKHLLCCYRKQDPREEYAEKKAEKKNDEQVSWPYHHIQRIHYRGDALGMYSSERCKIGLLSIKSSKINCLVETENYDNWDCSVSPDGKKIVYSSNRNAGDPGLKPYLCDLYVTSIKSKKEKRISNIPGAKSSPRFSPDGKYIAYLGYKGKLEWYKNIGIWLVPTNASTSPRNLLAHLDISAEQFTLGDSANNVVQPPIWSKDGKFIHFVSGQKGSAHACRIDVQTSKAQDEKLVSENGVINFLHFAEQAKKLIYHFSTSSDPGQIQTKECNQPQKACSNFNSRFLKTTQIGDLEEVSLTSAGRKIQGWILKPPNFRNGKKYPAILEIHGGPHAQYGHSFMHEFQYFAAKGYVVFFCNPRGSAGYGEAFTKACRNDWGTGPFNDLMKFTDKVVKYPYIDKKRLGITGGSYGGYMTIWAIAHSNRFKAAATQRCVSNLISMYGTSDFNWALEGSFGEKPWWKNYENYWKQSPLKYVDKIKTPTLIVHSENDLRTPIEQGEQLYTALKRRGVACEFIRFPGESHGLSRGGRTDRRIIRLEKIAEWFEKHL